MKGYAKAFTAALVAGMAFAVPIVDDGLTPSEVLGILGVALAAWGVVWRVPNAPPDPT